MHNSTVDSDFSFLEGTNCYCSDESAEIIREKIKTLPLNAVHLIGTGDYHYLTYFWTERIGVPFHLVLFDNHPDDQDGAFENGGLSCGNWVKSVRKLPACIGDAWNAEQLPYEKGASLYISIDLDVLSEKDARTNWDQGDMTLECLTGILTRIKRNYNIIGVDICGGISESKGGTENDELINGRARSGIIRIFL